MFVKLKYMRKFCCRQYEGAVLNQLSQNIAVGKKMVANIVYFQEKKYVSSGAEIDSIHTIVEMHRDRSARI